MHDLRALYVSAAVLCLGSSCSLLAPSDQELMGDTMDSSSLSPGGQAGTDPGDGEAGAPLAGAGAPAMSVGESGGAAPEEPDETAPQTAGAGGDSGENANVSSLISQEKLLLWLMADHGIGEENPGEGVAVWADQSMHESDAKQSLAALRPHVALGESGLPPMLEFDGVDDQLSLPEGFADFSAGLTIFIVANEATDSDCPSLLHLSNDPEKQDIEVGRFHGSLHYEVQDEDTQGPDNTFALNQTVLLGLVHSPSKAMELRINGVFMKSADFLLPVNMKRVNNFIGRSLYNGCDLYHGKIGEIIVYGRALDAAERDAVQRYLQKKWVYEPVVKTKPGPGETPSKLF